MKEIEQSLSYLLTCPCKDSNRNVTWKRSITLDLEYQNIKKKKKKEKKENFCNLHITFFIHGALMTASLVQFLSPLKAPKVDSYEKRL